MSAARFSPKGSGVDGCDSTGATMMSSTIMPSANPPVKHIPTAPTPGPPTSWCRLRASARSQTITGAVWFSASAVNSFATHPRTIAAAADAFDGGLPGVPNSDGITTVKPRSTTSFANFVTNGVMLGTSWMTTTPGPVPRR